MARCTRCCLHKTMRIVNLVLNLCGIGIIIYSLWLQKKWDEGVSELDSSTHLPKPWFIDTCLGVGIVVCLNTLLGHMFANCITNSNLCIYILSFSSLLLLQVAVIVAVLFKIDWAKQISEYIDGHHIKFKSFVKFHVLMCRLISVVAVVAQINVVVLAVILWSFGVEPGRHRHSLDPPDFTHSFLVPPSSPLSEGLIEAYRKFEDLHRVNPHESFLSYIKSVFRLRLLRRTNSR